MITILLLLHISQLKWKKCQWRSWFIQSLHQSLCGSYCHHSQLQRQDFNRPICGHFRTPKWAVSWSTTLIIRPLNSTNAAKSFESLAYFHQKFLSNWCRSKPNKWRQNSSLKLVFTLKFSPFQNDIKGWFSTFISHFPHDWTMALIVYTYKAQTQLFLVNFMKRDYIYFDCIDE